MMKKSMFVFLGTFVSILICLQMVLAATGPPIVWANPTYLSTVDSNPDQDPENSGYGTLQVAVWEHYNGLDWDIYMKYSPLDGAAGSWIFPLLHPATTNVDEINPAVSVTRQHPITGQEIHVVYQRWNMAGGIWEVYHTYTNNLGVAWFAPRLMNTMAGVNAIDPAISYAEDITFAGVNVGFLNQIVWAEETAPAAGDYCIQYEAHCFDPTIPRNYIGPTPIRTNPNGWPYNCMKPEIASIDDTTANAPYNYFFAIVWEEEYPTLPVLPNQWHIFYIDGRTQTSPLVGRGTFPNGVGLGQINPPGNQADALEPDIAATQDYQNPEIYFHHITYEFKTWAAAVPPFQPNSIETHYASGAVQQPGMPAFIRTGIVRGPANIQMERPTIASKLTNINPTVFESWVFWEDWNNPVNAPDIWFRMGFYTAGGPPFAWVFGAAVVGYPVANLPGAEHNPEAWNRNDASRLPLVTHLVFDDINPSAQTEVYYIDP